MSITLFVAIALYAIIGPIYLNRQLSKVKDS